MKKIGLSMLAIVFAAATVIANGEVPVKKANTKQATCTSCSKDHCTTKADCPAKENCPCK
ncbi:hypothetical protein FW774_13770 [Pedobacter sp. BS3]|uniref:hypothetical protein n=1 Tax=Pedobacter sp. BS3 TaxID=2567937 RepID=UPI0011EC7635|nr:hypothetical protein [Pedobacter sp. BS3]TZF82572.1 hypothetical protein FW774_13770 [Pedobacter sp. BS3]